MGNKYEVLYWDYYVGKEVTVNGEVDDRRGKKCSGDAM